MTEIWPIWQHNWIFILATDRLLSHTHQHVFLGPAVSIKTIIAILKDPYTYIMFQVMCVPVCFLFGVYERNFLKWLPNDTK